MLQGWSAAAAAACISADPPAVVVSGDAGSGLAQRATARRPPIPVGDFI